MATIPKNIVTEPEVPQLPMGSIATRSDILDAGIKRSGCLVLKNAIPIDIARKAQEAVKARARHAISCKGGQVTEDFADMLKIRS